MNPLRFAVGCKPPPSIAVDCKASHSVAVGCKLPISESVSVYVEGSLSESTRRAYLSDLRHFELWGGKIPSSDRNMAEYLAACAEHLSVSTISRRLASISKAHDARSLPNPARSELVKATIRGIRRTHGVAQRQAKPLLKDDLFAVLAAMGNRPKDRRDRALLLLGFAGGFRRSELVAIDCKDLEEVRHGLVVHLRASKTDQERQGRRVGIPHGRTRWCPVAALDDWLTLLAAEGGPVFRRIDRHGRNLKGRLSGEAVSLVVKERVAAIGLEPALYSGHSLRAGLATSAAQAGVSSWKIRQQTGHASDAMLARYIRDGELFVNNAAGALL